MLMCHKLFCLQTKFFILQFIIPQYSLFNEQHCLQIQVQQLSICNKTISFLYIIYDQLIKVHQLSLLEQIFSYMLNCYNLIHA